MAARGLAAQHRPIAAGFCCGRPLSISMPNWRLRLRDDLRVILKQPPSPRFITSPTTGRRGSCSGPHRGGWLDGKLLQKKENRPPRTRSIPGLGRTLRRHFTGATTNPGHAHRAQRQIRHGRFRRWTGVLKRRSCNSSIPPATRWRVALPPENIADRAGIDATRMRLRRASVEPPLSGRHANLYYVDLFGPSLEVLELGTGPAALATRSGRGSGFVSQGGLLGFRDTSSSYD